MRLKDFAPNIHPVSDPLNAESAFIRGTSCEELLYVLGLISTSDTLGPPSHVHAWVNRAVLLINDSSLLSDVPSTSFADIRNLAIDFAPATSSKGSMYRKAQPGYVDYMQNAILIHYTDQLIHISHKLDTFRGFWVRGQLPSFVFPLSEVKAEHIAHVEPVFPAAYNTLRKTFSDANFLSPPLYDNKREWRVDSLKRKDERYQSG